MTTNTDAPKHLAQVTGKRASARIVISLNDGVKASYPEYYTPTGPVKGVEHCNDDRPIPLAKVVRNGGYMARHSNGAWR